MVQVMSQDIFLADLHSRHVTKDVTVLPTPVVTGTLLPSRHSNLSWLDCKGAFVT